MAKAGHNSKVQAGPIVGERLKSFVERIEKMEAERKAIGGDIRDIYAEAKGVGYDVKTVRWVVQERRMEASDRAERDTLRDVYQHALDTAVGLVRGGLSLREAGRLTGTSKSSIHRALAVPEVSQPAGTKPENGDDGISQQTVRQEQAEWDAARRAQGGEDCNAAPQACVDDMATVAVAAPPGVVPRLCTPQAVEPLNSTATPAPMAGEGAGTHSDDDLAIPAHLRGPSPANRRVGA